MAHSQITEKVLVCFIPVKNKQEINQRQTEAGRGQGETDPTSKQAKVEAGTVNKAGEAQVGQKEWDGLVLALSQ